jgi:2-deoxy-D-gluconate 3-dehydrogenase
MVAVTGRNPQKNTAVAAELGGSGAVFTLDVRDETAVESAIGDVVQVFGRLDILVNNAGAGGGGPVTEMERAAWDDVIGTNLTGSFLCAKHAAKVMAAQGEGGKIINIGSMYSVFGTPNFIDYGASKAGVLGLTRGLAIELAAHDIQVNAILPGWFETEMTAALYASPRAEEIRRKTPAGRWGEGEDIVGPAVFLASAASDFVTGTAIAVDGGYLVTERLIH